MAQGETGIVGSTIVKDLRENRFSVKGLVFPLLKAS